MSTPNTQQPQTPNAQIVSILDVPSVVPNRAGKMDALITYRVDPLHSFTITLPAEDATDPNKVDAAIRQDYQKRKVFINRNVSL